MALKISGTTVIDDNSNGSFTIVTIPSTGFIEIPDNANTTYGAMSYRAKAFTPIQFENAAWSWWQKPLVLRDKKVNKDVTYVGYVSKNGSVGLSTTNNKTMQTNNYVIAGGELFLDQDDHNAGVVYSGNGVVTVFFQGRQVRSGVYVNNAIACTTNMFFVTFDENSVNSTAAISNYNNTIVQNITFGVDSGGGVGSFYPNILVANNKFLLIGRQTANSGGGAPSANNWNFATSNWPLTGNTISAPGGGSKYGFLKTAQTWPYLAISRSSKDRDKFVYALGWHPMNSNFKERHIYYGYLKRTAANVGEAWDVYRPGGDGEQYDTKVGCLVNANWTPLDVSKFELAAVNRGNGSSAITSFTSTTTTGENGYQRTRLFDVNDDRVAYGVFANNYVTTFNPTTSGNTVYQVNIANAFITTSSSSASILYNSQTITVSPGSVYVGGQPITIRYTGDPTNVYMKGYVQSYNLSTRALTFYITAPYGNAGPYSSWIVDGTSEVDDYYTSWVIRNSNTYLPNVATITSYNGTTKIATLETSLNTAPVGSDTITLSGNNVYQYYISYKLYSVGSEVITGIPYVWLTKRLCTGGRDFSGGSPAGSAGGSLDARQYAGGMAFSYDSNTLITVCREVANTWIVEEIELDSLNGFYWPDYEQYAPDFEPSTFVGNTGIAYTVISSISSSNSKFFDKSDVIYHRPVGEMLSEDTMIYDPSVNTRTLVLDAYFNKRDYQDFDSDLISSKSSNFESNTISTNKSTFNNFSVSNYIELSTPTAIHGYSSGGLIPYQTPIVTSVHTDMIQRFPFASDTNATDFGDLVSGRYGGSGSSSTTDGYSAGGQIIGQFAYGGIEKFSFTTGGLARIVGNLTEERRFTAGHSSPSHGYTSAGIKSPTPSDFVNTIDKYPFSVDTNATNVGDLSEAKSTSGGASSLTNGYVTGGTVPPPTIASNVIDKFPFSSDTNSTDIGDLVDGARRNIANQSDPSGGYGYATGGLPSGPSAGLFDNFIERFSFVSNGNSVDVGDLSQARRWGGGISSSTHGYYAGGGEPPGFVFLSSVEKFPFSSSTSGTNVLNLAIATYGQFTHEG